MNTAFELFRANMKFQTVMGVCAILLGIAAIAAPFATGMIFSMMLAIGMCALGISGIIWLFKEDKLSTKIWIGLLSLLCIVSAYYMYQMPGATLMFSTWALIAYFTAEAVYTIIYALKNTSQKGWGWTLFYGIVTMVCAGMLFADWPITGIYAIGTFLGVKLVFLGISILSVTSAQDVVVDEIEDKFDHDTVKA